MIRLAVWTIAGLALLSGARGERAIRGQEREVARTASVQAGNAWTLEQAMSQLRLQPRDPYLQYVALQLARRENDLNSIANQIEREINRSSQAEERAVRAHQVDLFSLLTGALAVQESLQLDAMRGGPRGRLNRPTVPRAQERMPGPGEAQEKAVPVSVADLSGPTIKSHPWKEMLGGRRPDISPLCRCVPEDFYYVEFRSISKLLEAMAVSDLWSAHLFHQAAREARTQNVGDRLKRQLVIESNPLLQPFYDLVVAEIAVVGSDLFLREGSDVTLLFRQKQPDVFKARMEGFLKNSEKSRPDAKRNDGRYRDTPYVHLETPDREVNVYAADLEPDLHVRSNSYEALRRIVDATRGKTSQNQPVHRLGDTAEFAYIRTLMPRGAPEEDGFIYLSDPFIRRLVGPERKLTERRRMLCYNHLRMIGHASLLYQTENGKPPASIGALAEADCCPGPFNEGELKCPDGGTYSLAQDGTTGVCSHHGHAQLLRPCCEIPVARVGPEEAAEYRAFLSDYNQYWRTYFDPIAIRIQITPKRYRLETIVLPLIDNSIYTGLARILGPKAEPLDILPVPKRNIFSVAVRVNKAQLLQDVGLVDARQPAEGHPQARQTRLTALDRHCLNNLKQLGLSLHNYHDVFGCLPTVARLDAKGKPLLSWRVELLPYLDEEALYKEFHLDEPWDSEHNKKLIGRMPACYRCPSAKLADGGKTTYLAPVGKNTMFPSDGKRVHFADVADGLSNTLMLVDAEPARAVNWTKPDDLLYDPAKPRAGLGGQHTAGTAVLFGDGSTRLLPATVDNKTLQALFTRNGGEVVDSAALGPTQNSPPRSTPLGILGLGTEVLDELNIQDVLAHGVSSQVGFHVYDAPQMFDFNLPEFLGMGLGSLNGGRVGAGTQELAISFLIASLNAPVYISIPTKDNQIVDRFLERLDSFLVVLSHQRETDFLPISYDFYTFRSGQDQAQLFRSYGFRFGPVKWRFCWARIGNGLYIASKPFVLEDLVANSAGRNDAPRSKVAVSDKGPEAHAMVRVRPENWNEVLPDFRAGWAENNREACLQNLGPLSSVARAFTATQNKIDDAERAKLARRIHQQTDHLHTVHFFCPEGGNYVLATDGKSMTCSVHGGPEGPRQPVAPSDQSALGQLLKHFGGMTAALTFTEEGLRAVVVIDRK
jgi:hypothetical protein